MSTNIPKTPDFGASHFAGAPLSKGYPQAETWCGRGLEAINQQREKGMNGVVKDRIPEDSSAPTD